MSSYRTLSCPFCGHRSFCIEQNVDDPGDLRLSCLDCGQDRPDTTVVLL